MEMDDADWPLRSNATTAHHALEHILQDMEEEQESFHESKPSTPHPPSLFSAEDYRSILKAQSPFSEGTIDEYVLNQHSGTTATRKELLLAPRLVPRARSPRPSSLEDQTFQHLPLVSQSSPSLSSSVTTASSSPASPNFAGWPFSVVTAQLEPLRTKRRFSSLRTAKRLPHHNSPPWEVHAIIQVRQSIGFGTGLEHSDSSSQLHALPGVKHSDSSSYLQAPGIEDSDSSRTQAFPGFDYCNSSSQLQTLPGLGITNDYSAYIDGDHLTGFTLTHSEPASGSGQFVHYRGASFEVLNPHASLIYGARSVETPAAEIDGLLDDCFDTTEHMDRSVSSSNPGDGESAVSAILADYDHTTYPPTNRPVSSQSDDDWLELIHGAHEVSPGLPYLAAYAVARGKAQPDIPPLVPTRTRLAAASNDPPTTDRTYGDTNRLLQLTPHTIGLARTTDIAQQIRASTAEALSRDGSTEITDFRSTLDSIPESTAESELDNSESTVVFNPFMDQGQTAADDDADWVTDLSHSEANRFSYTAKEPSEHDYDGHREVQPASVLDNHGIQHYGHGCQTLPAQVKPAREEVVQRAARTLSVIYHSKIQAMASTDNVAVHSDFTRAHRQAAVDAEAEIERLRQEDPDTFSAAVESFIDQYGPHTAVELTRAWSDNNRLADRRSAASENSFDQVIRMARAGERAAVAHDVFQRVTAAHNHNTKQAGLQYSPTADTFATSRPIRSPPANRFLQPQSNTLMMGTSHQLVPDRHAQAHRPGLRNMASMSSQTGLRDLHLTSTPTSNIVHAGQEIIRRPATPMYPRPMLVTPPRQHSEEIEMATLDASGLAARPATLQTLSGNLASRDLMSRHLWNPIALIIIWAGGYNKVIARTTHNVTMAVSRDTKIESLKWAALELAILVILGSLVAMFAIVGSLAH
ncbi:hypothetical protein AMS68_002948 [Peltaster fructicola]|uniref:Uncharacterized protein n=1 Tax=Peltaster fructicola TaxID=286661 RepID=A0A6H0XRZ9_9PEZI|nr:hypothetical protein AMS68_002948 [Peltaster fructicola]